MSPEAVKRSLKLRGGQLQGLLPGKLLLNVACQLFKESAEYVHWNVSALGFFLLQTILVQEKVAVDELFCSPAKHQQGKDKLHLKDRKLFASASAQPNRIAIRQDQRLQSNTLKERRPTYQITYLP